MKVLLLFTKLKLILDDALSNYNNSSNVVPITNNTTVLNDVLRQLLGINIDEQIHEKRDKLVFFAHLNEFKLYVSLTDSNNISIFGKDRYDFNVDDKYFFYELDGWNQLIFLPLLAYFFLREYFKHKLRDNSVGKSDTDTKAYGNVVLEELWRAVNAFRIKSKCDDAFVHLDNNKLINVLTDFVDDLKEIKSVEPDIPVEIIFPAGLTKSHAIYLSFTLHEQSYYLVIYNTGLLSERHLPGIKNFIPIIYPYVIGTLNSGEDNCVNYLRNVCANSHLILANLSPDQKKRMLDTTYNSEDTNTILSEEFKSLLKSLNLEESGLEGFDKATKGDCVTRNYLASIFCRNSEISRKPDEIKNPNDSIYELIFNKLIKFTVSRTTMPDSTKYKSPLTIRLEKRNIQLKKHINSKSQPTRNKLKDSQSNDSDITDLSEMDTNNNKIDIFNSKVCIITSNELNYVYRLLNKQKENLQILAIIAPQGGGKTTFIQMFYSTKYSPLPNLSDYHVHEFNASSRETLKYSLTKFAISNLCLKDNSSQDVKYILIDIANSFREKNKKVLFIFENANNENDIDYIREIIRILSANGLKGYLIIAATQDKSFFKTSLLDYKYRITNDDGVKLFLRIINNRVDREGKTDAKQLVNDLECNLFYLTKVAYAINEQGLSYKAGVSFIDSNIALEMKKALTNKIVKSDGITSTIDIKDDLYCEVFIFAIVKLLNRTNLDHGTDILLKYDCVNDIALVILFFCAYLNSDNIICDVIHGIMAQLLIAFPMFIDDPEPKVTLAIATLAKLQLININDGEIIIHKATQIKIRTLIREFKIRINNVVINNEFCLDIFSKLFKDQQDCSGIISNSKYISHMIYLISTIHSNYKVLSQNELELLIGIAATTADYHIRISRFVTAKDQIDYYSEMLSYLETKYGNLTNRGKQKKASLLVQRGWIGNLLKDDLVNSEINLKNACKIRQEAFSDHQYNPYTIRANIQYVLCLLYNNKLVEAKKILDSLDKIYSEEPKGENKLSIYGQYLYIKAYYAIKTNNHSLALRLLNNALKIYKPNESFFRIQILNALGVIAFIAKQFNEAKKYFIIATNETKSFNNQGVYIYIGEELRTNYWLAKTELELGNAYGAYEIMTHVKEIQNKIYKPFSNNVKTADNLLKQISTLMPFNYRPLRDEFKYNDNDIEAVLSAYFALSKPERSNSQSEYSFKVKNITHFNSECYIYVNASIFEIANSNLTKAVVSLYNDHKSKPHNNFKLFFIVKTFCDNHKLDCYITLILYTKDKKIFIKALVSDSEIFRSRIKTENKLRFNINSIAEELKKWAQDKNKTTLIQQSGIMLTNYIYKSIESDNISSSDNTNISNNNQPILILKRHIGLVIRASLQSSNRFIAKHTLKPVNISNIIIKENSFANKKLIAFINKELMNKKFCILPHKTDLAKFTNSKLNDLYSDYTKQYTQCYTIMYKFDCNEASNLNDQLMALLSLLSHPVNTRNKQSDLANCLELLADNIEKLESCLLIFNYLNKEIYALLKKIYIDNARFANKKVHLLITFSDNVQSNKFCTINISKFCSQEYSLILQDVVINDIDKKRLLEITENNYNMLMLLKHLTSAVTEININTLLNNIITRKNELLKQSHNSQSASMIALLDIVIGYVHKKNLLSEISYTFMLLAAYAYNTIPLDFFDSLYTGADVDNIFDAIKHLGNLGLINYFTVDGTTYVNIMPSISEMIREYFKYICSDTSHPLVSMLIKLLNLDVVRSSNINELHIYRKIVQILSERIQKIKNNDRYIKYFYFNCNSILKSLDRLNAINAEYNNSGTKKSIEQLIIWTTKYLVRSGFILEAKKWILKIPSIKAYVDELQKIQVSHDIKMLLFENRSITYGNLWKNVQDHLIIIAKIHALTLDVNTAEKVLFTAYFIYSNNKDKNKETEALVEICNILLRTGRLSEILSKKSGNEYYLIDLLSQYRKLDNPDIEIKLSVDMILGIINFYIGNTHNALKHFILAKDKYDERDDTTNLSYVSSYIGNCYLLQGKFTEAKTELEDANKQIHKLNMIVSYLELWISCVLSFTYTLCIEKEQAFKISQKIINLIKIHKYENPIFKVISIYCLTYSSILEAIEDKLPYDIEDCVHAYNLISEECKKILFKFNLRHSNDTFSKLNNKEKIIGLINCMKQFFSLFCITTHPYIIIMDSLTKYYDNNITTQEIAGSKFIHIIDNINISQHMLNIKMSLTEHANQIMKSNDFKDNAQPSISKESSLIPQKDQSLLLTQSFSQTLNPVNIIAIQDQLYRITNEKWIVHTTGICIFDSKDPDLVMNIFKYLFLYVENITSIRGVVQIKDINLQKLSEIKPMESHNNKKQSFEI